MKDMNVAIWALSILAVLALLFASFLLIIDDDEK